MTGRAPTGGVQILAARPRRVMGASDDRLPASEAFRLVPRTRAGWITVWLTAAFAACFGGAQAAIAARGVNDANPWRSIFGITGLLSAIGAGIAAFVAVVQLGERSLRLVLPALLGVIVVVFIIGEFNFPHCT